MSAAAPAPLSWLGIARLGLVQCALGSVVVLTTSVFNRVMVVELALAAMLPAALVAWHYTVQVTRPVWGHASDRARRRTPFIIGGMGALAFGALLAADAVAVMAGGAFVSGLVLSVLAYSLIGLGVGACGTALLALLAARTAPARRPMAAALTWIMMIAGIAVTAGVLGPLLDPFSTQRLVLVASGVGLVAFLVTVLAVWGVESAPASVAVTSAAPRIDFKQAMRAIWADARARAFTVFVFISMLAYSAQDLILEPFAGLVFNMTLGQSTQLTGVQHAGVLLGMLIVGGLGARAGGHSVAGMRAWTFCGCVGSALALLGLAAAPHGGPDWPLAGNVFLLGFGNGVFAVGAIGTMLGLAGESAGQEGARMGVWGAAQAIAFAAGGFLGAAGVDALRAVLSANAPAFTMVFVAEAGLFLAAAALAWRLGAGAASQKSLPALPTDLATETRP